MTKQNVYDILDRVFAQLKEDDVNDIAEIEQAIYDEFDDFFDYSDPWGDMM